MSKANAMTKPHLIALYSPAPQSGKSTSAGYLEGKGYKTYKFAQPLKDMLCMLLMHAGYTIEEARELVEEKKNTPLPYPFGGKTPRDLMKSLGTQWGREMVGEELWTGLMTSKLWRAKDPVVVDDMRFPDEFDALKGMGAKMVRIDRPGAPKPTDGHRSEGQLDAKDFDAVVENSGTLSDLRDSVYKVIV